MIQIFSKHQFLLEIQGMSYCLDDATHIQITDYNLPVVVKVYPLEQSNLSLPFCFKLESKNGNVFCNNILIETYHLKNRTDIFINPFKISSNICTYTNYHTIKNVRYTVCVYADRIKIYSSKGEYIYEIDTQNAESYVNENYIIIKIVNENIKYFIYFNVTNNVFEQICGNKIEIENNKITTLTHLNNTFGHIKVCKYNLSEELTKQSEELFLNNPNILVCKNSSLIPYNFFEAIMCKDETLARSFLTEKLSNVLTTNAMYEYFGDFKHIHLLSLSPLTYTLYSHNSAKDYFITMQNDKILDISD